MTRKEKLNIAKAGVSAYAVSSFIAWLKEGGIKFVNQADAYVVKIHKTMGVIDVFRLDGHLKTLDVFGGDWIFVFVGMFSAGIAAGVMKAVQYFSEDDGPKPKKKTKGYTVKMNGRNTKGKA